MAKTKEKHTVSDMPFIIPPPEKREMFDWRKIDYSRDASSRELMEDRMAYDDYCHVEKEALYAAVRQALETAGKVDIIFPAGSMVEGSPTNYLLRRRFKPGTNGGSYGL